MDILDLLAGELRNTTVNKSSQDLFKICSSRLLASYFVFFGLIYERVQTYFGSCDTVNSLVSGH